MKATVVPAEITSLKDTIAGNLTLTQIVLLVQPILISAVVFVLLPPVMFIAEYKLVLIVCLSFLPLILSTRVKGELTLDRFMLYSHYVLRPRVYVLTKPNHNDCLCLNSMKSSELTLPIKDIKQKRTITPLDYQDELQFISSLKDRKLSLYSNKEGRISGYID